MSWRARLDPELAAAVDLLPELDVADAPAARRTLSEMTAALPPYRPRVPLEIDDRAVPGREGSPNIPVRVYTPGHEGGPAPAILFMHGGGFVIGDLETEHGWAAKVAATVGAVVVSVDYRLAPENPYPAALDDCFAALEWVVSEANGLGIDRSRVAVMGTSAGGGLAAAVALLARDRGGPTICFQHLAMPSLDDRLSTPSMTGFIDTPGWRRSNATASWSQYLGTDAGSPEAPAYAAPSRAEDLAVLPPAYLYACELDPLRDEGLAYAQRLVQAGVPTEAHLYPGTFHGSGLINGAAVSRRMNAESLAALGRALSTPGQG